MDRWRMREASPESRQATRTAQRRGLSPFLRFLNMQPLAARLCRAHHEHPRARAGPKQRHRGNHRGSVTWPSATFLLGLPWWGEWGLQDSPISWSPLSFKKLSPVLSLQRWPSHSEDACVLSCFSHVPTLCDLMDCSPPGSSVHGISQARILKWVAIPFSRGSSQPRD